MKAHSTQRFAQSVALPVAVDNLGPLRPSPMKRTTVKDIGRLLDVSPSTVSRALADHPDISAATKARVRDVAEAMGYIPNLRARYLRARHSRFVALVVPEMNMFFVPALMTGINRVLQQNDYSLVVFQSDDVLVQERKLVRLCLTLSMDGVLLARSSETTDLSHLDALRAADIPVVLLDKILETDQHSTISIDDARASREATDVLLERGHTTVIGVFGDARQHITSLREDGFRAAFAARDLPREQAVVVEVRYLDTFDDTLGAALDAHPEATAVFVMSDELLVRAHHLLLRRGARIPEDLSVVAISDGVAPYFLYPNVTHVRHSGAEVGIKAAHVLLGMMQPHDAGSEVDVRVQTRVVKLDSVRDLRA